MLNIDPDQAPVKADEKAPALMGFFPLFMRLGLSDYLVAFTPAWQEKTGAHDTCEIVSDLFVNRMVANYKGGLLLNIGLLDFAILTTEPGAMIGPDFTVTTYAQWGRA